MFLPLYYSLFLKINLITYEHKAEKNVFQLILVWDMSNTEVYNTYSHLFLIFKISSTRECSSHSIEMFQLCMSLLVFLNHQRWLMTEAADDLILPYQVMEAECPNPVNRKNNHWSLFLTQNKCIAFTVFWHGLLSYICRTQRCS